MADITSQYSNLLGSRLKPAANVPAPPVPPPANPLRPVDNFQPSPQSNDPRIAGPMVTPPATMREELLRLRQELADINKQIDSLIARCDTPAPANPAPANNAPTDDDPIPSNVPAIAIAPMAVGGTHTVQPGDYLWKIAREKLGDANRWTEIYELNKDVIGANPNLVAPGQELRLPSSPIRPVPNQPSFQPPIQTPVQPVPSNGPPMPPLPPPLPPKPPVSPQPIPTVPPQPTPPITPDPSLSGTSDIPAMAPSGRPLSDADATRLAAEFGLAQPNTPLTPALKANVALFLDEMDSYETVNKGKVFGPGMEALAANPQESQQIRASVTQIQQALDLLLKSGKLKAVGQDGKPIQALAASGSFFAMNNGQEVRDAQNNPVMDDAFVSAITQFKQDHGIHQQYRLADGTFGINEYVGPATIEALKKALVELQPRR